MLGKHQLAQHDPVPHPHRPGPDSIRFNPGFGHAHFACPRSPAFPLPVPLRLGGRQGGGPHCGPRPQGQGKWRTGLLGAVFSGASGLQVKMETPPWISSQVAGEPGRGCRGSGGTLGHLGAGQPRADCPFPSLRTGWGWVGARSPSSNWSMRSEPSPPQVGWEGQTRVGGAAGNRVSLTPPCPAWGPTGGRHRDSRRLEQACREFGEVDCPLKVRTGSLAPCGVYRPRSGLCVL